MGSVYSWIRKLPQRKLGGEFLRQPPAASCWSPAIFLALGPLLAIYLCVTLVSWPSGWTADEVRYLRFAENLCRGRYALPDDEFLWNGPGYPLMLATWLVWDLPPQGARFANAGFLYLASVLLAHCLALYVPRRWAIGTAWAMGLHLPLYTGLGKLMSENFVVCLVSGACLASAMALRNGSRKAILCAGLLLGELALTKILFGYVLLACLVTYALLAAVLRKQLPLRRITWIYLLGLASTAPYLAYTYRTTGKAFYWSNSGGLSLYWMSTPYRDEWGDWFHPWDVARRPELARHQPFFASLCQRSPLEKDAALRQQAMANIRANPAKFLRNVAANMSRIWFSFPYSYTPQKITTLFYIVPNTFLLWGLIASAVVLVWRRPPAVSEGHLVLIFSGWTLAGSALLSAYPRMLDPIVPAAYLILGVAAHTLWPTADQQIMPVRAAS